MIARFEDSVAAILVGVNTLTANDGTVNPQEIVKSSCRRSSRNRNYVKLAPITVRLLFLLLLQT